MGWKALHANNEAVSEGAVCGKCLTAKGSFFPGCYGSNFILYSCTRNHFIMRVKSIDNMNETALLNVVSI